MRCINIPFTRGGEFITLPHSKCVIQCIHNAIQANLRLPAMLKVFSSSYKYLYSFYIQTCITCAIQYHLCVRDISYWCFQTSFYGFTLRVNWTRRCVILARHIYFSYNCYVFGMYRGTEVEKYRLLKISIVHIWSVMYVCLNSIEWVCFTHMYFIIFLYVL